MELREEKTWQLDGPGGREIALEPEVLEALRNDVIEGFLSLPRRGAEVGGLLLGRFDAGGPACVCVEKFEAVRCEHRFGPSYVLSETDLAALEQRLGGERGPGAPQVVGFYRSYTGRDATPDAADEELFRKYFRDPRYGFLLIRPLTVRNCAVRSAFWEDGDLRVDPVSRPLAPDACEPRPGAAGQEGSVAGPRVPVEPALPRPAAGEASAARSDAAPPAAFSRPMPMERRRLDAEAERPRAAGARLWPLLLLLLGAAAGVGSVWLYRQMEVRREARPADLGLRARHTAAGLRVTWNRAAPAVLAASRGSLIIGGSQARQQVELSQTQVRSGEFDYSGTGDDLRIDLKLYGGGQPAAESIRVLKFTSAAAPPEPQPATANPAPTPPEPPAEPVQAERVRRPTPARKASAAAAIPPAVLHQVQPGIPAGIRARIRDRVVVPVTVQVSDAGRVVHAVPQSGGDALQRYLADYAARAARWWRFAPARTKNGQKVPASKTIYFVFTP